MWVRHSHKLAIAILLLALLLYSIRLGAWRMYDDEGGYLYAAWRISKGEVPYRDFLSPQMPLFLYIGSLVVRLLGPSAIALRALTMLTMLGAAWLSYLLAKEAFSPAIALFSLAAFLMHRNVYYMARFFRSEAYMLFFDLLGLYLGLQFCRRDRAWLAWAAGGAFALATLCKLFGLLPFAGYLLFLLWHVARRRGEWGWWGAIWRLAGPVSAFAVVLGIALLPFYAMGLDLSQYLLGHHLRQGAELSRPQIFVKGIQFLWAYGMLWPVYTALTLVGAAAVWRQRSRYPLGTLFLAQLPGVGVFLVLSRAFTFRLLVFLAPTESVLVVLGAAAVLAAGTARLLPRAGRTARVAAGLLLAALALVPHLRRSYEIACWQDDDTMRVVRLLGERIGPDEVLLSDYPGLNFYAQRESTYLGAGLSGGAVGGGQIRGDMLARELESAPYQGRRWLIIDVSPETGHTMVSLHDHGWFLGYLDGAGFEQVDELARGEQLLRLYRAESQPDVTEIEAALRVDLGTDVRLLGYHLPETVVRAGTSLPCTLYWQARVPVEQDYKVFVHLVDAGNTIRVQDDVKPRSGRFPTYLWTPGPVIVDVHRIALPPDLPPGVYMLGVGMYPFPDAPRLPAIDQEGARLPDDWIALPVPITIE